MILHCKIGTISSSLKQIWKRKLPVVKDIIRYRDYPRVPGQKWETGIVEEIRNILGTTYYYISKF